MRTLPFVGLAVAAAFAGCEDGGGGGHDDAAPPPTADGAPVGDVGPLVDANLPLSWVDFGVSGCRELDPGGPTCRAAAPARLRFVAIAPAAVETWLWDFGDGTTGGDADPEHVYLLPGTFTLMLSVGGPGGTASRTREAYVVVEPAAAGGACSTAAQCGEFMECVCAGGAGCPPSLAQGLCARECGSGTGCGAGSVCADLAPAGDPEPDGWRRSLCLPACGGGEPCPAGLVCRELRDGAGGGWVQGCFAADLLADDGASCVTAAGLPDDAACASGRCVALGARGLCAAACGDPADCPSHAACATLGAVGELCLARCAAATCAADPWLACEAADPSGELGFTVTEPPSAEGYCAPRRCTDAAECAPDGACDGGFCR